MKKELKDSEDISIKAEKYAKNPRFPLYIVGEEEERLFHEITNVRRYMTRKGFYSKTWIPKGETIKDKLYHCAAMKVILGNY